MRFVFVLASFLAFALSSALAAERLPDVDAAIDYLARQQNANGSIHAATDIANPEQSTSEALMALKRWGSLDRIDQESAASYLVAFSQDAPTEYLARAIAAQRYVYETPPSILEADLCNRWHQSGAFGFLSADEANVYSTAYAVAALSDSQCPDAVHSAIEFLLSKYEQSGWRNQAGAIDIDLSLRVWHALFPYRERSNVASVLDQSLTLFAGGSYSSAEREAYRLLAIMLRSKDPSSYVDALAAFIGLQSESGSWGESAYLTALALNVLSTSAEPVPNPDLGTVSGTVINAIEGLPLVGAAIELSGPIGFNEVTDALGDFSFGQLPAGIYELRLNTEGYGDFFTSIDLKAGADVNLGVLALNPLIETENAVVEGVITRADNGSPLSGATVTVGEHVATTDANGTYRIEGVPSGGTTITAKRPYFSGASATLNVKPGSRVIFSPSLVYSWQAPRISGTVTDSVTGAYLPGAQISLSGANEETITSNGSFLIAGLNTGVTQIEATLPGYLPASTEIDAQPGATYNFHPKLVTESSESISVQGIVINMETQQPVPGALIDLTGNNVATVQADSLGRFIASNLLPGETSITVRAPNFDAVSGVIVLSFGENLFLTLEAPPSLYELPSANVTGRVLAVGTDIPVPGAVVRVLQNDVERVAVADSRGVFKLVDVTTGVWEGSVDQINYGSAPLTFQMPRDAADIDAGAIYLTENIKLPDLVILAIDRSTIYTDPSSFLASGSLIVALKNIGQKETLSGFRVIVYEDRDANMSYNETVDRIVGSSRSEALVQPGENGQMAISIDGQLQFRDAPLRVKLDVESEVTELLEDNNDAGSCELAKCGE